MPITCATTGYPTTILTAEEIGRCCANWGESLRPLLERLQERDIDLGISRLAGNLPGDWAQYPVVFPARNGQTAATGRNIVKHFARPWDHMVRPGELARIVLKDALGKQPITSLKREQPITAAPLYFKGRYHKERVNYFVEVDIKACYAQLLSRLAGPCVDYGQSHFAVNQGVRWDREAVANKYMGRAIAGMFYHRRQTVIQYGKIAFWRAPQFYNPAALDWMHDILHCIAWRAVRDNQCLYWHTDGGIFLGEAAGFIFQKWLQKTWGLRAIVKRKGYGYLRSIDDTFITDKQSKLEGVNWQVYARETADNLKRQLDEQFLLSTVKNG